MTLVMTDYFKELSQESKDLLFGLLRDEGFEPNNLSPLTNEKGAKIRKDAMTMFTLYIRNDLHHFMLFKPKWKLAGTSLSNPDDIGKLETVLQNGFILQFNKDNDFVQTTADTAQMSDADKKIYDTAYSRALTFANEDVEVYHIANEIIQIENQLKEHAKYVVKTTTKTGKPLKGSDIPVIDFENEANAVAKIVRSLNPKTMNKVTETTGKSIFTQLEECAAEYATIIVNVTNKEQDIRTRLDNIAK